MQEHEHEDELHGIDQRGRPVSWRHANLYRIDGGDGAPALYVDQGDEHLIDRGVAEVLSRGAVPEVRQVRRTLRAARAIPRAQLVCFLDDDALRWAA